MTIQAQYDTVETTVDFLNQYGLMRKYIAQQCGIHETAFSGWLNHSRTITEKQLKAVQDFISDYRQRMS